MTIKEFWLRLFAQNDIALACVIHSCEKSLIKEFSENSKDFIQNKIEELYEEAPQELIDVLE